MSRLIRDQGFATKTWRYCGARRGIGGKIFMQTIRPDNADPIPLRHAAPRMGTIMIRFVGMLVAIVVVLALLWSR